MKIIRTRDNRTVVIFGADHSDPIEDYIDLKGVFSDERIYRANIASEIRISPRRILIVIGLAFVAAMLVVLAA